MRKKHLNLIAFIVLGVICFSSLSIYYQEDARTVYTPIFMSRADLEASVKFTAEAQELKQPGKIYYKAPYIFINEKYKGVHVINNSNPAFPKKEGFITSPGCLDIAVKGNVMYLDNGVDLVAFDLLTKKASKRIKGVLPEPIAPDGQNHFHNQPADMVVVGWKKTETK